MKINKIVYLFWAGFAWALFHLGAIIINGFMDETSGFIDCLQHAVSCAIVIVFLVFAFITYLQNK